MSAQHYRASIFIEAIDGSIFVNNFGYVQAGSGDAHVDTSTAAGAFQTLVQAAYVAALPGDAKIFHYRFACVEGAYVGEIGFVDVSPPVAGTAGFLANYPNEICISMKRSTGYSARTERGRIFFGPVSSDYSDTGGNVNRCAAGAATLTAVSNLLKADLTIGGTLLHPVLVDSAGESTDHPIIHTTYALEFVHRRSRRPSIGN